MKRPTAISIVLSLLLFFGFTSPSFAGFEPSPFQPALTIENNSDNLDVESPFYKASLEAVTIEFFYMGADGSMVLWGSYFITNIESGEKYISESTDWDPSIPLEDIPAGATIFAQGIGSAGEYPMMIFPEDITVVSDIPDTAPFVELMGYDPTGGVGNMLPIFAFEPTDAIGANIPGIMVGLAEVTFEELLPPAPTEVTVPSEEAPTIQAAIDLVADGGTVEIGIGVFTEQVFIEGKTVNIQGSGALGFRRTILLGTRPDVMPSEESEGMINFGPGGGGKISNLVIRRGNAGIVGFENGNGSPTAVHVDRIRLVRNGRGILWRAAGDILVTNTVVRGSTWNGLSFVPTVFCTVTIRDVVVGNAENICALFSNTEAYLNDDLFYGCKGGGVVVDQGHLDMVDTNIYACNFAGVALFESTGYLENNIILGTDPFLTGPYAGGWGDGITAWLSPQVSVVGNRIINTARVAVSNLQSHIEMASNRLTCQAIDLAVDPLPPHFFGFGRPVESKPGTLDDQGGNLCGCPIANSECDAESTGLLPPEAIDPDF